MLPILLLLLTHCSGGEAGSTVVVNIASIEARSSYDHYLTPEKALDNDWTIFYHSADDQNAEWLKLAFAGPVSNPGGLLVAITNR